MGRLQEVNRCEEGATGFIEDRPVINRQNLVAVLLLALWEAAREGPPTKAFRKTSKHRACYSMTIVPLMPCSAWLMPASSLT